MILSKLLGVSASSLNIEKFFFLKLNEDLTAAGMGIPGKIINYTNTTGTANDVFIGTAYSDYIKGHGGNDNITMNAVNANLASVVRRAA